MDKDNRGYCRCQDNQKRVCKEEAHASTGNFRNKGRLKRSNCHIKVCGSWGIDLMQSQKTAEEIFLICLLYQTICTWEAEKSDEALRQAELWSEKLICPDAKDSGTPAAACNPSKVG